MKSMGTGYFAILFLVIFSSLLSSCLFAVDEPVKNEIFDNFKNPPREYSIIPLWSWNGTLEPNELKRQIDLMMDKGVYGAFMHARAGIDKGETPYFSEGWWKAVETAVEYSNQKGFLACLYDEDKWPSGSAGGRTLERNPKEFIKKGLQYDTTRITGPAEYIVPDSDALKIFAVRLSSNDRFRASSQRDITDRKGDTFRIPRGDWTILTFTMIEDRDRQIDYLDPNAVAAFIDITHEEYFRRFGKYFGNTIPGVFFDEIFFRPNGRNVLPWTDDLTQTFQKRKGYDLLDDLPSLVLNSENTARVNYDFLDEVSERYYKAWFEQYNSWCKKHNIWVTGHTEEYTDAYKRQGDYIKTIGSISRPATDNEEFRYGFPRYIDSFKLKQVASAAHLHGQTRVGVEAMGGGGYMITPEEYRYGFARFGVCGLNFFIPHLFHYSIDTADAVEDWPPSWFFRNPYWKYFKPLADYGRRISFMNSQGHHICHVALLNPLTDQWIAGYNGDSDTRYFIEVQDVLLNGFIDYDIINPASLVAADCKEGKIKLQNEGYSVLVLPSLTTITQQIAEKIKEFVNDGGVVVALGRIPGILNRPGEENTVSMSQLFGIDSRYARGEYYHVDIKSYKPYTSKKNEKGGYAYYSSRMVNLPVIAKQHIPEEIRIISGDESILRFHQRQAGQVTFYLLMNESKTDTRYHLSFPDYGVSYMLDIETGEVTNLNCLAKDKRMEFVLDFKPWQAFYIAFVPGDKLVQNADILASETESRQRLQSIELDGLWNFMPVGKQIDDVWTDNVSEETLALPVIKFYTVFGEQGDDRKTPGYDDSQWATVILTGRFSQIRGGERYLSTWNACQIVSFDTSHHFPSLGGDTAVFKKTVNIEGNLESASLTVIADPSFRLLINQKQAGESRNSSEARSFDIASFLKAGENSIKVEVPRNKSLLVEGYIQTTKARYLILSNKTWTVELDRGTENAFEVCKPPMGSLGQAAFPGRSIQYPVTGWYRQILPAGTQKIILPEYSGQLTFYINGKQFKPVNGIIDLSSLKEHTGIVLAIKCVFSQLTDGLQESLNVICKPEPVKLADWTEYGLAWFSGRGIYSQEINLTEKYINPETKIILDLGKVNWFAELWVNDKLVKYFPWGEFSADITDCVKPGVNKISVIVSNLRANEAYWDTPDSMLENARAGWWHQGSTDREKQRLESGLFGPVRLNAYQRFEKDLTGM